MHQRPIPLVRSSSSLAPGTLTRTGSSPRLSPLLPSATVAYAAEKQGSPAVNGAIAQLDNQVEPSILGLPLKYVS
jgi:UDP-sugar transporter A1/2/3